MPKCIPCMSEPLKEVIRKFTDDPQAMRSIKEITTCPIGVILNLCTGRTKTGRARSAYQEFTSQCLKSKKLTKFDPTALKDCAAQWRQLKKS